MVARLVRYGPVRQKKNFSKERDRAKPDFCDNRGAAGRGGGAAGRGGAGGARLWRFFEYSPPARAARARSGTA
jgi:hypothetical protein